MPRDPEAKSADVVPLRISDWEDDATYAAVWFRNGKELHRRSGLGADGLGTLLFDLLHIHDLDQLQPGDTIAFEVSQDPEDYT